MLPCAFPEYAFLRHPVKCKHFQNVPSRGIEPFFSSIEMPIAAIFTVLLHGDHALDVKLIWFMAGHPVRGSICRGFLNTMIFAALTGPRKLLGQPVHEPMISAISLVFTMVRPSKACAQFRNRSFGELGFIFRAEPRVSLLRTPLFVSHRDVSFFCL